MMDGDTLKQFKVGEQVTEGVLFPGLDDEEVRWTATNIAKGVRQVGKVGHGVRTEFAVVDFDLDYLGVPLGTVRAYEQSDNTIKWEAVK